MRTIATLLLLAIGLQLAAQKECATAAYTASKNAADPSYRLRLQAVENFIQQSATYNTKDIIAGNNTGPQVSNVIRIPVVVHVLYNNAAQNISDEQIQSGIEALNRDFRKRNSDTAKIPLRFKAFAADVEIEFVLATSDPNGKATTGIVREQTKVADWSSDDNIRKSAKGGDDAWDSKSYLNIWIGSLRKLLGYASVPGDAAALDGVVISPNAFGTINTKAPYNMGRTAVHEVGHWLGLRHIWGDGACGDDYVDDTPKQGDYTAGLPTGFRSSCSNAPLGDMYMNYMDFTDDAGLMMFTWGQKSRMRALFNAGGPRNSLLHSKGLNAPAVAESPLEEAPVETTGIEVKTYPNPAVNEITVSLGTEVKFAGSQLYLLNMQGAMLQTITLNSATQKISLAHLKAGMYLLQGTIDGKKVYQKIVKL